MNFSVIFNVGLIIVSLFIFSNLFISVNRNKKVKKLIDIMDNFENKDLFFLSVDNFITSSKDKEFIAKANIIKLWGLVYYKKYDLIKDQIDNIEFKDLVDKKNRLEINEDSLYYYLLASINNLYSNNRFDLIEYFDEKLSIKEELDSTLIYKLYKESLNFYYKKEDRGETFFLRVREGDYLEYTYSKILIGLYKGIINALLAALYIEEGRDLGLIKEDCTIFNKTYIGKRYIKELNIDEYFKED